MQLYIFMKRPKEMKHTWQSISTAKNYDEYSTLDILYTFVYCVHSMYLCLNLPLNFS